MEFTNRAKGADSPPLPESFPTLHYFETLDYIFSMGRKFLFLLITLLLITSCMSSEKRTRVLDDEQFKRIEEAVSILQQDAFKIAEDNSPLSSDEVLLLLSDDTKAYGAYLPLYDRMESEYVKCVEDLANVMLSDAFSAIGSDSAFVMTNPVVFVSSDNSIAMEYERIRGPYVLSVLNDSYEKNKEKSEEALSSFLLELGIVKRNYDNLSLSGYGTTLAEAKGIEKDDLINFLFKRIFDLLANAETMLKNAPLEDKDSPYSVFWEDYS